MAAVDLHAQALAWATDEIGKQCFGEDFGVAVTWGPEPLTEGGRQRLAPGWLLMLTARNPELGQGPLYHGPVGIGLPAPVEAQVRKQVTDGLKALRELAASKLAGANGHPRVPG